MSARSKIYDSPIGEDSGILHIRLLFDLHGNLVDFAALAGTHN
ncbi:MAG: hypothetical protein ACRDPY_22055 [Streptosporangiaceae bacterium]